MIERISKKKIPPLTKEVEAQILQNVLSKCGKKTNSVPLEALDSYSNYRQEKYIILRGFIIVILILFLLLPALFLWPELTVHERTDMAANHKAWNVTVDAAIPIRKLTAKMNGRTVPVYEAAGTEYLVMPSANGIIDVTVTLKNGQVTRTQIEVDGIDNDAPKYIETRYDSEYLYIVLSDDSGIDPSSISLTDENGEAREIISYTEDPFTIKIRYPDTDLILAVSDIYSNPLRIKLKAQK